MSCTGKIPIAGNNTIIPFVVGTVSRCSTIELYNYTGEKNVINKQPSLSLVATLQGQFRYANIDLLNPTISIDINTLTDVNLTTQVNYVYIADFDRYYFVNSKNFTNTLCEIELAIDVLYTYKTEIMATKGIIDRGVLNDNNILTDANITIGVEQNITVQEVDLNNFFVININNRPEGDYAPYVVSYLGTITGATEKEV